MNKKFISILLSILLPVFLVGAVVYATTSVGTDISVEGDLDLVGTDLQKTTGTLNISKSGSMTTVKGTLNVDEAVTLDLTIAVTGTTTLATTTIGGTLGVTGATTLTGLLTTNGGISIGANALTGTTGNIDYTYFDVLGASGNTTIVGTLGVTGTSTLATTTIGSGGTAITKHLSVATTSVTSPSIAATSCADYASVTVTGAAVGDTVIASPQPATNGIEDVGLIWNAYVSAGNTVVIRACNPTTAAIDTDNTQTWRIDVWRH